MDMISNLPSSIIESILCLIPIQEAARTSILAKEWRYYWTKIPKLVFDEDTFQVSTNVKELSILEKTFTCISERKNMTKRCKLFYAIYQVMLMHEGPIHEFTLSMDDVDDSCTEIDQILIHLSRKNTVKKLTLELCCEYRLPLSLFSSCQLTDLCLHNCDFFLQPTFNGFGSLKSLYIEQLYTTKETLLHLLSACPLLKSLSLNIFIVELSHAEDFTIINLFECLLMLENLSIWFWIFEYFVDAGVPKELPTTLVYLKYLGIHRISFVDKYRPFLFLLIRSSPNLEKLKLEFDGVKSHRYLLTRDIYSPEEYSAIRLERLKELEIINLQYTHVDFVKHLLTKSPVLNKVRIFLNSEVTNDGTLEILEIILLCSRVSLVVEIID